MQVDLCPDLELSMSNYLRIFFAEVKYIKNVKCIKITCNKNTDTCLNMLNDRIHIEQKMI